MALRAGDSGRKREPERDYLSVAQFAKKLGVTRGGVRKWMNRREISYAKIGPPNVDQFGRDRRKVMIPAEEVKRLVEDVPRILDTELGTVKL